MNQVNDRKVNRLTDVLNVLADPVRVRIVLCLVRPTSISSLQNHLKIGQNTLLHHLTRMQDNGLLVAEHSDGKVYYSLPDRALERAVRLLAA